MKKNIMAMLDLLLHHVQIQGQSLVQDLNQSQDHDLTQGHLLDLIVDPDLTRHIPDHDLIVAQDQGAGQGPDTKDIDLILSHVHEVPITGNVKGINLFNYKLHLSESKDDHLCYNESCCDEKTF